MDTAVDVDVNAAVEMDVDAVASLTLLMDNIWLLEGKYSDHITRTLLGLMAKIKCSITRT